MNFTVSDWNVDSAANRVWWDHTNDDVPRIWLERDGTFFFNLPKGGTSKHVTFKGAAELALYSIA